MNIEPFSQAGLSNALPEKCKNSQSDFPAEASGRVVSDPAGVSRQIDLDPADRLQRIWDHPLFQESLATIEKLEQDRIFCGHDRTHLFDVARIAYIENLEKGAHVPRHLIYAAALLHDIGRHLQYLKGTPHHEASAELAAKILPECGFSQDETQEILDAIRSHRDRSMLTDAGLSGLIYRADKRSRCCFACPAEPECDWEPEKKNMKWSV